jgi:hypothetical protein
MQEIPFSELDTEMVTMLPSKETLWYHANWSSIYATNSSLALNVNSILSHADSYAYQSISVSQH